MISGQSICASVEGLVGEQGMILALQVALAPFFAVLGLSTWNALRAAWRMRSTVTAPEGAKEE